MKRTLTLLILLLACALASAGEVGISSREPALVVTAPDNWVSAKGRSPTNSFPFETCQLFPPSNRNAMVLISILANDKPELASPAFLKKLLRGDSRPYVNSSAEQANIQIKELKIAGGLGYYANFIDPALVGKRVKRGSYKTATPVTLSLGANYLLKVTILCDDLDGADYREAMKIVESIRMRNK